MSVSVPLLTNSHSPHNGGWDAIVGRVIMHEDQVARIAPNGRSEQLGYAYLAGIDGPDVELYLGDNPVFRVEQQDPHLLMRQPTEVRPHKVGGITG